MPEKYRFKTYPGVDLLDGLIRHPRILDAVEAVIGPNILCWSTDFFIKEPHDPGFVSWHQDSTYWGLEPPEVITAWLGLTDSTPENGCVRVVAGSHLWGQVGHHDTFGEDNLLSRGQEVMVEVDESEGVDLSAVRRGDLAPPCPGGPWLAAERIIGPPHRDRLPLPAHPRAPRPWGSASRPCSCEEWTSTGTST